MNEKGARETIHISDSSDIVVHTGSKVTVDGMVVIEQGGEELVHANAVVDFKDIPVEHHATVANLLMRQRMRLVLPSKQRRLAATEQLRKMEERRAKGWLHPFGAALTGLMARMKIFHPWMKS